jgi:hypothetical protein
MVMKIVIITLIIMVVKKLVIIIAKIRDTLILMILIE